MLTISLRPPREGDGPGLARTWIDAGRAYADRAGADVQVPEADGLAAWLERSLLSPGDDVCVLVAEHNDEVVGFVLGSLARPVPDAAKQLLRSLGQIRLVVDALAVQDSYRRLGVGTTTADYFCAPLNGRSIGGAAPGAIMNEAVYDQHAQFYLNFVDRALANDRSIFFQHLALYQQILDGRLADARVLDLACGEGYLARFLAQLGAREVVGIDLSAALVAAAVERTTAGNVSYGVDDAQSLRTVADRSFDLAVCQMALMDIPDHRAFFRSVRRVLTPTGMFVFSLLHPCFESPFHLPEAPPLLEVDGTPQAVVVRRYRTEGFWQSGGTGVRGHMGAYHRTVSTLLNDLRVAGFHLEQLEEPVADEDGLFAEVPRTMVIAVQAN